MKEKGIIYGLMLLMALPFISCNRSGGDSRIDKVSMVPVKVSKDKWSFVNEKGEIVFEDEFEYEPSVVYNGFFSAYDGKGTTLYKVSGNKFEPVGDLDRVEYVGFVEDGLVPATPADHRIGVYDTEGTLKFELTPVGGVEIKRCAPGYSDGLLVVITEEFKVGFMDTEGKMALKPIYDGASYFNDGLAVVSQRDDEGKEKIFVINKNGETQFKLKEGMEPKLVDGRAFVNGYMIVKDEDRDVLYDKKGEVVKFSTKVKRIKETDGKYVIFSNDDNEYGVVDMKGEIIIKAKYKDMDFANNGNFLAQADKDEWRELDKNGDEKMRFDYKEVVPYGKFGYFAYDGKRYSLVDAEAKTKGKEDFKEIGPFEFSRRSAILSDYTPEPDVIEEVTEGEIMTADSVAAEIDAMEVIVEEEEAQAAPADNSSNPAAILASMRSGIPMGGNISQFNWLSTYRIQPQQLAGISKANLRILRNAVFAIHGYKFNSADLQQYFGRFAGYRPVSAVTPNFNQVEQANITLIKSYE